MIAQARLCGRMRMHGSYVKLVRTEVLVRLEAVRTITAFDFRAVQRVGTGDAHSCCPVVIRSQHIRALTKANQPSFLRPGLFVASKPHLGPAWTAVLQTP